MLQSIVHIALVVRDYDEAIDFYTNRLHFTLIEDSYQPEQDKRTASELLPAAMRDRRPAGCLGNESDCFHRPPPICRG